MKRLKACRMSRAHSPTLPMLHLRHSSFYNPSFASPTSQDFHLRHLGSRTWAKVQKSAGKVILSGFYWNCHGAILQITFQRDKTITCTYESNLLYKLRFTLKNKRRGMLSLGIRLLADNVPSHSSQIAVDKARACGFGIFQGTPYFPDPAHSNFFCLQK